MARTPKYKAAETEMRRRIMAGDWPVGTRLGNEFQLADEFGVSQGTMRRALMTLEADGLLARKPGRGTIVAAPQPAPAATAPVQAGALMDAAGTPATLEIHRAKSTTRRADAAEAALFGPVRLHAAERLLRHGGTRAALETLVVPDTHIAQLDETAPADLPGFLSAHGLDATVTTTVAARMTTMSDAVALSCDRHTALLILTRTAHDASGQPVAQQTLAVADGTLQYREG